MNEDIIINIEAKYQQLTNLIETVNKLTKSFKMTAKNKNEIQVIVDLLEKAADPIKLANELLAESSKQIEAARKNLEKLVAVGADSASIKQAERQVEKVTEQAKNIAKAIKISPSVQKQSKEISNEYELQRELTFRKLLAEQIKKHDEEEAERKQRLYEQQKQISEKIKQDEIEQYQSKLQALEKLKQQIRSTYEGMVSNEATQALQNFMLSLDPTKQKLAELTTKLQQAQTAFVEFYKVGDSSGLENAKKQIESLKNQIEKTQESQSKSKKGGWLSVLFGRIRNISIYRMIRSVMKWFTSGIQEGLGNLAQYSSDVNDTLSNVNASLNQVRSTLAISFASILKSLEPIISQLSSALVDLINNFNLALAKMQGQNVYLKAKKNVEDYSKSVQKAQKLSFDTFEVLSGSGKTSPFEMFEDGDVQKDTNKTSEAFENLLKIIKNLWEIVKEFIKFLITSGILQFIVDIVSQIADLINVLMPFIKFIAKALIFNIQSILLATVPVVFVLELIIKLVQSLLTLLKDLFTLNWGELGKNQEKIWKSWKSVDFTKSSWKGFKNSFTNMFTGYENGGIPEKSELFYMNENGVPEALMNTGGSQTNVINQQQLRTLVRDGYIEAMTALGMADGLKLRVDSSRVDDNAFARAIFPALKTESTRLGGNQL